MRTGSQTILKTSRSTRRLSKIESAGEFGAARDWSRRSSRFGAGARLERWRDRYRVSVDPPNSTESLIFPDSLGADFGYPGDSFYRSRRRGWKTRRELAKRVLLVMSRVWLRCSVTLTGRGPLKDYCTGLLMPGERKSVEPIASIVAPWRVSAEHQSLLHFVGQSAWSD